MGDRSSRICNAMLKLIIPNRASTMRIWSTLLRHGPGTLVVVLAMVGSARDIHWATYMRRDDAPSIIAKFSTLKAELPNSGMGCYVPPPRNSQELRRFGLAQYALIPLVIKPRDGDCPWTLSPDFTLK